MDLELPIHGSRPTVSVTGALALGRVWILFESKKTRSQEKCLKMRQNPQRPVHALFGGVLSRSDQFTPPYGLLLILMRVRMLAC